MARRPIAVLLAGVTGSGKTTLAEAFRLVRGRVFRDLAAGARPLLVHLPISFNDALERLTIRNRRGDANALAVTAEALTDFFVRFEAPEACEHAVSYVQNPTELLKVVRQMQ